MEYATVLRSRTKADEDSPAQPVPQVSGVPGIISAIPLRQDPGSGISGSGPVSSLVVFRKSDSFVAVSVVMRKSKESRRVLVQFSGPNRELSWCGRVVLLDARRTAVSCSCGRMTPHYITMWNYG